MSENAAKLQENTVDNSGTDQDTAREMLKKLSAGAGDGGLAHLGLIMGRPEGELQRFMNGEEPIDDDFVMKMRGIAGERGIDIS